METNIVSKGLADGTIEMAERKRIGYPDTLCNQVTEQISIEL